MTIAQDMLDVLRCPHCVSGDTRRSGNDPGRLGLVRNGTWLVCQESECNRKYPIEDGIPVMLIEQGAKWANVDTTDLPDPDKPGDYKEPVNYKMQPKQRGLGNDTPKEAIRVNNDEQAAISEHIFTDPKARMRESDQQRLPFLLGFSERLMDALWARHEEQIPSHEDILRDPESVHEFNHHRFPLLLRLTEQLIREISPRTAVDIGAGRGVITAKLRSAGVLATCLDLNRDYLLDIRQREHQSNLVQGDCANLPFADASFDLVVATDVIEHVPLYEQALCGCGRVARNGFLFSTNLNGLHRIFAQSIGYDVKAWDESIGHLHVYSYSKLMRLLSANLEGFQLSRPECLFVTPFYLSILTLNYRLPAVWTRPLLRIPNWLATRFPAVLGNWIALCATRPGTRALDRKARSC